jgi:hypothetical protein
VESAGCKGEKCSWCSCKETWGECCEAGGEHLVYWEEGKEGREGEYAGGFIGLCRLSMWSSFHLCHHGVDVILVDGATLVRIIYDEFTSIKKVSSMLITLLYQ